LDVSALLDIVDQARSLVFTENYSDAEAKLKIAGDGFRHILGSDHWLTLIAKLEAALMHVCRTTLLQQLCCFQVLA
jgi:hypothetical protein